MMMKIFRKNKNRDKYVGARLSPRAFHYLSLYSIAKDTDRAKIIRGLVDNWMMQKRSTGNNDPDLIRVITSMINSEWHTFKIVDKLSDDEFAMFLYTTRTHLYKKGISEEQINEIMRGVKNDKEKLKTT